MKATLIIVISLAYVFIELPIEITDNFLAYLVPFIISIIGLSICLVNFRFIDKIRSGYKRYIYIANFLTVIIFAFLTIFNFPVPERSGLRCKNWTDISMLINPKDTNEQFIFQSLRISGSMYSHRQAMVEPITPWLRWHHNIIGVPQSGKWLYIDNSKGGENAVPFTLDNSKIDFKRDKSKAIIVTLEKGRIINNP